MENRLRVLRAERGWSQSDLAQQLDGGLGWFWSASHSQIYPELKRLEDAGLVESEPESPASQDAAGVRVRVLLYAPGAGAVSPWAPSSATA